MLKERRGWGGWDLRGINTCYLKFLVLSLSFTPTRQMFFWRNRNSKWFSTIHVCIHMMCTGPCRASVHPSVLRRGQVSAKEWHMASALLQCTSCYIKQCVYKSPHWVWEEESNVRVRNCDSHKSTPGWPNQDSQHCSYFQSHKRITQSQGRTISHPLRSQAVLCHSLQVVQSLNNRYKAETNGILHISVRSEW